MTIRELRTDEVEFTRVLEHEDDLPIEGYAMASGDDAVDQECYAWIRNELAPGNYAAWARVRVIASWRGFRGVAAVGGCSYKSEKELWAELRPELDAEALADLNASVARTFATLETLETFVPCPECGKIAHEHYCSQTGSDE